MTPNTDPPKPAEPTKTEGATSDRQPAPASPAVDPALAATSEVMAVGEEVPAADATPVDPLEAAKAEATRMKEQWIRTAADFDNFRKRSRRDLEDARKGGHQELLKELLPVFDNLERAMQSAQRATEVKAVTDGLSMIQKQFNDTLGRVGILRVATVGKAFDPSVHEAIQQVETSDHEPGIIVAEVQPGYVQGERLIRAAMVVVAKPKTEAAAN